MKKKILALFGAVLLSLSLIGASTFSVIADENTENDDPETETEQGESDEPSEGDNPENDENTPEGENDPENEESDRDDGAGSENGESDREDGSDSENETDTEESDGNSEEDGTDKKDGADSEEEDAEASENEAVKEGDEEASSDENTDDEALSEASARLERALDAYQNVLDSEYDLDKYLQDRVEKGSFSYVNLNSCGYRTSDDVFLDFYEMPEWAKDEEDWLGPLASWAALCNYYDDYINHDADYYDFGEYITTHTAEELAFTLFDRSVYDDLVNDSFDMWEVPMVSVVRLMPYLSGFDEVTLEWVACSFDKETEDSDEADADEMKSDETDDEDGTESDDDPVYELHIFLNGEDSGVIPVFDGDGNLLNFDLREMVLPNEIDSVRELPVSFDEDHEIFDRWWLKITECE